MIYKNDTGLTPRQRKAALSKAKIFESAQYLFAKHGYNDVTVADICKRAGVSTGLFYNYYSSKSEIALDAEKAISTRYQEIMDSFTPEDSAISRLEKLASGAYTLSTIDKLHNTNARTFYIREVQGEKPSIFSDDRDLLLLIRRIVQDGQSSGQLNTDIAEDACVRYIQNNIVGLAVRLLNVSEEDKENEIVRCNLDFSLACRVLLPK